MYILHASTSYIMAYQSIIPTFKLLPAQHVSKLKTYLDLWKMYNMGSEL